MVYIVWTIRGAHPMNSDSERKKFEKYLRETCFKSPNLMTTDFAWEAWQEGYKSATASMQEEIDRLKESSECIFSAGLMDSIRIKNVEIQQLQAEVEALKEHIGSIKKRDSQLELCKYTTYKREIRRVIHEPPKTDTDQ
jgi:hypothetical protein